MARIELPDSICAVVADAAAAQPVVQHRLGGYIEGKGLPAAAQYRLHVAQAWLEQLQPAEQSSNGAIAAAARAEGG